MFLFLVLIPVREMSPEGLGKLKKFIHLIGSRTRDLPSYSTVPQSLRYCVPHIIRVRQIIRNIKGARLVTALLEMRTMRSQDKILVGKCEAKRTLGRPTRSWENILNYIERNRIGLCVLN
jgi:hypothetical protein